MNEIPVLLDAISGDPNFSIARCIYFHIEIEDTLDPWQLGIGPEPIPFFMVGLAGILIAPSPNEPRFREIRQLRDLIDNIESRSGHNVETADIWFPAGFLPPKGAIKRGDVLRVQRELFVTATMARAGGRDFRSAFANISSQGKIETSLEETRVFAGWAQTIFSEYGRWQNLEQPPRKSRTSDQGGSANR